MVVRYVYTDRNRGTRLENLIAVEDEVLPQDGQAGDTPHRPEMVEHQVLQRTERLVRTHPHRRHPSATRGSGLR